MRAVVASVALCVVACSEPPPDCAPTSGPFALVEGDTVIAPIVCSGEAVGRAPDGLVLTGLPDGATFDPVAATVTWTPGLDQAAVYDVGLAIDGEDTLGTLRLAVADAFDTEGNVPPLDPLRYPEELGLPTIFVTPRPTTEAYEPVTIVYGGHAFAAEAKLRGASSLSYPKQSYTLKFPSGDHFDDPARGLGDRKRVVLTSTFDDNSYVRQRLTYDVWNAMSDDHVAVRTASAAVYLDGEFHGLYTLGDHVDDDLFALHGLAGTGNVYKAYNHDANFMLNGYEGDPKATLHDGYTKKDGQPPEGQPGAFDDLDALVDFVARANDATFAAEVATRVHLPDFRDWYVLATFVLGSDSGGKNCYLYHDPAGGPWRYAPWDWNHSFGQAWETSRTASDDWDDFRRMNRLFVRILDDATLGPTVAARYRELLEGPIGAPALLARYDAMIAETAAVARRDWRKWGEEYRTFDRWRGRDDLTDYDGEVAYVRGWIAERDAFLRTRFGL